MPLLDTLRFSLQTLWLSRMPRQPPERIAALQRRRLRRLVRRAIERAPFYRDKYRGLDLRRFTLADLPTTKKSELMAHFDEAVTDPRLRRADLERFVDDPARNLGRYYLGRYAVSHTSGSQGQPVLLMQERWVLELLFGFHLTRGNSVSKANPAEAVRRFFHPARLAVVSLKRGFYPSASAFAYMPAPPQTYLRVLQLSQTDPDLVERLNAFQPTALTGYAGILETLALEAHAGRLRLAPELGQIVNNSEVLTERARARVEAAFGVPVLDNYATGECPFLTSGCPTDLGAHVNADWAILEVVDEAYRPVPPGTTGRKVLITNLANTVQPILRYEVTDLVTMAAESCRCGNRFPRIERIDGRTSDAFWIADAGAYRQVTPRIFKHAFDHLREVREWQAVQTERNRVKVRLELVPGAAFHEPHVWQALNRQLERYALRDLLAVEVEVVPALAPDPATGKFRRSQSLVGPPLELPAAEPEPLRALEKL